MALTDTRLRAIRPTGSRFDLPDRDGLSLRVSQRGIMTWAVAFRVTGGGPEGGARRSRLAGKKQRISLGEYPAVSLSEAREKAINVRRLARAGTDPLASSRPEPRADTSVNHLIARFTEEHLRRNIRTGGKVEQVLALHVTPRWGDRDFASITRSDFVALLEAVRQPAVVDIKSGRGTYKAPRGGPGAAAEVRKWVRAMFQHAYDAELLPTNPLAGVRNRDRMRPRNRVLTMDELRAVWNAADALPFPWGPYFRLIMLTGDRRGEWANAQAEWLNADQTCLEIPASAYKTGKAHVVPLSRQAQAIVASLPSPEYGSNILSSTSGLRPISDFSGAKAKLDLLIESDQTAKVAPWVVHDLRRSMATHMERLGVAPHVIEVCLGHTLKGIGATYRHYSYLPEKTAALQLWADEIAPVIGSAQK